MSARLHREARARRRIIDVDVRSLYRIAILMTAVVVAFRPSLGGLANQLGSGSPMSYLLGVPLWCATIAWGQRHRVRRGLDIHDRQLDWLVAITVAVVSSIGLAGAQRRLGDVALLWRLDLLALVCWTWACSVVLFGTRATMTQWPMWVFALLCWPAPYLLGYAALGGGPAAVGWLAISLAAVAALLAADGRARRIVAAAITAVVGAASWHLTMGSPAGSLAVLTAVLPLLSLTTTNRLLVGRTSRRGRAHASAGSHFADRGRSIGPAVGLVAVGALVGATIGAPFIVASANVGPMEGRPSLGAQWELTAEHSYAWVSAFYGPGTTLRRYSFSAPGATAAATVDVLSNVAPGALVPTVLYDGAPGLQLGKAKLAGNRVGEISSSDPRSELDSAAGGWVSLSWLNRELVANGRYQQVTVFSPQAAGSGPPAVVRPSIATTLIRPADLLLRGAAGATPRVRPSAVAGVERLADLIIQAGR